MAETQEPTIGGPYLAVAVFCEKVLQEGDGVMSLIRIVDRTTVAITSKDAPEDLPPVTLEQTLVLSFKSGFARGKMEVTIKPSTPSGQQLPAVTAGVLFEGHDRGVNLVCPTRLEVKEEGLYWFDVYVGPELATRVPYRVLYQRIAAHQS